MAFSRRWLLILFVLLAGGGPVFAASREDRAYAAALLAFHDKFYSLAQSRLTQFLDTYRDSTNEPAALLLLAQSEYYLKDYAAVTNRLGDPASLARAQASGLADRYVYWRGEAEFAQGDLPGAARTFGTVVENFPGSPLALNAAVAAAAAFAQGSNWAQVDVLLDSTNGLFQRAARLDPANEQVASGWLLQGESKCAQSDFGAALEVLGRLNPALLGPDQDWKRAYLVYRAHLGRNDLDPALAAATNLLQIARAGRGLVWATNLAVSVTCHARVLEEQGRLGEAAAALQENLTTNVPAAQQQATVLKLAELAVAQNQLADAEAALDGFVGQFPDSPAADVARLTLGELHLRDYIARSATNDLARAETNFLAAPTSGPLAGKVFLDRGWCDWLGAQLAARLNDTNGVATNLAASLTDFQSAVPHLSGSPELAVARYKMGDAQFAQGDFAGAQTNYQAVLTDFSSLPEVTNQLAAQALYQILRAQLAQTNVTGVDDSMRQLLGRFGAAAPVESALLLAGQGLSALNFPQKAREVFQDFEGERPHSPLVPEVVFAAARTFEQEANWPATVSHCEVWLDRYPTNTLRPQVEYTRNWAVFQMGDEARAFELFSNFVARYPTNINTPLALWWVADHYFRLGGTNYQNAEYYYQRVYQDFPTNELAARAQLMAGRAAMGRFGYQDAIRSYFTPLISDTNCPEDLRDQARFAYSEAWRLMPASDTNSTGYSNLQQATNVLGQMFPKAATNLAGVLAWCEAGDCDLQLGAFDAATNAYAMVFNSPLAANDKGLRGRAQIGFGLALEKKADQLPEDARKALLDQAMENYADVFASPPDTQDAFWRKNAALKILALNPKTGTLKNGELENFLRELKATFPQLQDSPELKRLAQKN